LNSSANLLDQLTAGSLLEAERSDDGAKAPRLATGLGRGVVFTRRVTTPEQLEFDRTSGALHNCPGRQKFCIVSTQPLPDDIHAIFVWMDKKLQRHSQH